MNRRKKLLLNSISGTIKQLVTLLCGAIITKFVLKFYGSEINGLVITITQYLAFIAFLELGIGAVVQSNLYEPLAKSDKKRVVRILKSSEKFFRRIAYIFIGYIIFLCIFYPYFITTKFSRLYVVSLFLILSASILAQYLFGITYQLLLNADQKSYIQNTIQWVTLVINTVASIALMSMGFSIHIVRLVTSIIYVARPILLSHYVKKHYDLDVSLEKEKKDPIQQKWNGFAQHIASVVADRTDVMVLAKMTTSTIVSVYYVYFYVVNGMTSLVISSFTGLEATWGNMLANKEDDKLIKSFSTIEWLVHTIVTGLFLITAIMITDFVMLFTKEASDANYYQPVFGVILTAAFAMRCLRLPYFSLINSALHYKQTQNGSFITAIMNITISIILVNKFGLVGVAIGTLIALSYHTLYFVHYLKNNIIHRKIHHFIKHILVDMAVVILSILLCKLYITTAHTAGQWILNGILATLTVGLVSLGVNMVFYKEKTQNLIKKFTKIFRKIFTKISQKRT